MNLFNSFNFPTGEMHVILNKPEWLIKGLKIDYFFQFERNEHIIELLLAVNALENMGVGINTLTIPYIPFSRQDRVCRVGECFSLSVFAKLINSIGANEVVITDPHSDVTPALINNCRVITQDDVFAPCFDGKEDFYLISPDGGALKKIYKLEARVNTLGVIECSKNRDVKTGYITNTKVYTDGRDLTGKDCYIVDDICDGGRTFIEIAKELKKLNVGKIVLMVSHGFFTKGLQVFDNLIDEIHTSKGRIK